MGRECAVRDQDDNVELRFNLVDRTAAPLPYKILMHGSDVVLLPDIAPDLQLRLGCLSQIGVFGSSISYAVTHEALQTNCTRSYAGLQK